MTSQPSIIEKRLAIPMSVLAFLFLIVTAYFIQFIQGPSFNERIIKLFGKIYLFLWLPFIIEAIWIHYEFNQKRIKGAVSFNIWAPIVLPPLRLIRCSLLDRKQVWIPFKGWRQVDQKLRNALEDRFNLPMLFFALLILPVLGLEYLYQGAILEQYKLRFVMEFTTALIWLAFTVEFIIMASLSEKWFLYCKNHWLELAIILLPFIAFLRSFRIFKVAKIAQMGRSLRLKRLVARASRALVMLDFINRIIQGGPEKQLKRLRQQQHQHEKELSEIEQQIKRLQKEITN
jgi:hypothetical protein